MAERKKDQRVGYDKVWGGLLALSCVCPIALPKAGGGSLRFWWTGLAGKLSGSDRDFALWLIAGSVTGLAALTLGLLSGRTRWRHFVNFLCGAGTTVLALRVSGNVDPAAAEGLWGPLASLASAGSLLPAGLLACYLGAGMRIARPRQPAGLALGGLGSLLLLLTFFVPVSHGAPSLVEANLAAFQAFRVHWRSLLPLLLLAGAGLLGFFNLLPNRGEVFFARATRMLLLAALLFWLGRSFLEQSSVALLPRAWYTLRFFGPVFLAFDGAIAFTAITLTRSTD